MKKLISLVMMSILIFTLVGCNKKKEEVTTTKKNVKIESETTTKENESDNKKENESDDKKQSEEKKKAVLFFSDDQAMYLEKEEIEVEELNAEVLINKLLEGPKQKNHYAVLPKEAKVLSVKVKDNTAYVDFDKSISKKLSGSSAEATMLVNAIGATLTLNKDLNIKNVQLLIDGNKDTVLGPIDISQPIKVDMSMIK
ncbi:GerMN domain-containing protein [Haloimpatiens sp. FM7330]|uniref:GerMN domain-containing protein n=1 Tax=Haloimpatiens sp. FM7330 TaxID=3298610 RepID=UPI00362A08AB